MTIHWVDSSVDTGKIIKQVRMPRLSDMILSKLASTGNRYKYQEVLERLGVARNKEAIDWKEFSTRQIRTFKKGKEEK